MPFLYEIFINILSMSTIASVVFFLILLAKKLIKNKINIQNSFLLWIIFIFVLLIPIKFESSLSLKNYIDVSDKIYIDTSNTYNFIPNEVTLNKENSVVNYKYLISYIWLVGFVLLSVKDIFVYSKLLTVKSQKIPFKISNIFEKCRKRVSVSNIGLKVQDKIRTPFLLGVINPKIYISKEILSFSKDELECVFIHELNHYKKHHHIFYLLALVLQRIHWFNPIVKIALKMIKQDIELITDSNVINLGLDFKRYCRTIVKVAGLSSNVNYEMPSICNDKNEIERRIKEMKNKNFNSKLSIFAVVIALFTISLVTISIASDRISEVTTDNDVAYILPLESTSIACSFGIRVHPITKETMTHNGVDLKASTGDSVKAVKGGIVKFAGFDTEYGNNVVVEHNDGVLSKYAHGSKLLVVEGDRVNAGDEIMLVGQTGMATGPHLHFEMQNADGEYIDVNQMFEQ